MAWIWQWKDDEDIVVETSCGEIVYNELSRLSGASDIGGMWSHSIGCFEYSSQHVLVAFTQVAKVHRQCVWSVVKHSSISMAHIPRSCQQVKSFTTNSNSMLGEIKIMRGGGSHASFPSVWVTVIQLHSPAESGVVGDAERTSSTCVESQWLEMSRKRTASGSCVSPRSSKSSSPGARSMHHKQLFAFVFSLE